MQEAEAKTPKANEWEEICGRIRQGKRRATQQRKRLWEVMRSLEKPAKIEAIYKEHYKALECDLVTLYRNLEFFLKIGIVKKRGYGERAARYDYNNKNPNKHYILVKSTGELNKLPAEMFQGLEEKLREITRKVTGQGYRGVTWDLNWKSKKTSKFYATSKTIHES